jgi:propanediol dehydratase small subunit
MTTSATGVEIDQITLDNAVTGKLRIADTRIGSDALKHQAQVAHANDNPQLAENLLRAAELVVFSDAEVLSIYDALRPGRSSLSALGDLAADLTRRGAPRCAALVAEAQAAYAAKGVGM